MLLSLLCPFPVVTSPIAQPLCPNISACRLETILTLLQLTNEPIPRLHLSFRPNRSHDKPPTGHTSWRRQRRRTRRSSLRRSRVHQLVSGKPGNVSRLPRGWLGGSNRGVRGGSFMLQGGADSAWNTRTMSGWSDVVGTEQGLEQQRQRRLCYPPLWIDFAALPDGQIDGQRDRDASWQFKASNPGLIFVVQMGRPHSQRTSGDFPLATSLTLPFPSSLTALPP